jgi:hypothetical protein
VPISTLEKSRPLSLIDIKKFPSIKKQPSVFALDQCSSAFFVLGCPASSAMPVAKAGDSHEIYDCRVELGAFPFSDCHRCGRRCDHAVAHAA